MNIFDNKDYYYIIKFFIIPILLIFNINISNILINGMDANNYIQLKNKNNFNCILRIINKFIISCRKGKLINKIPYSFLEPKITAIIILYNSEKTIKSAIRSIQNQNISDIELIIVDDFSSDNSIKTITKIAEQDHRIKIIKNNKNRGSLYSRSIGALNAKGKYIMALDSDDLFSNEYIFYICYKEVETYNLDILEYAGFHIKKKILRLSNKFPKKPYYLRYKKFNKTIKQPKLFNFLYRKNLTKIIRLRDAYIWGKCIKATIYQKSLQTLGGKVYTRNINFGEDRIVNFVLFFIANSFKFINEYGIIYYYNPKSINNSYKKDLITHDEIINLMNIYKFTKDSNFIKILSYELIYRWELVIKPGLNEDYKNIIKNLIKNYKCLI